MTKPIKEKLERGVWERVLWMDDVEDEVWGEVLREVKWRVEEIVRWEIQEQLQDG